MNAKYLKSEVLVNNDASKVVSIYQKKLSQEEIKNIGYSQNTGIIFQVMKNVEKGQITIIPSVFVSSSTQECKFTIKKANLSSYFSNLFLKDVVIGLDNIDTTLPTFAENFEKLLKTNSDYYSSEKIDSVLYELKKQRGIKPEQNLENKKVNLITRVLANLQERVK